MNYSNELTPEEITIEQTSINEQMKKILLTVRPIEIQVRKLHLERENLRKLHLRYERRKFELTRNITKISKPKAPKVKLGKKTTKPKLSLKELSKLIPADQLLKLIKGENP